MATSPTGKSLQEDAGTEEVDPAKKTEEEEEQVRTEEDELVGTEEVDPAKTTEEDDEARTEEDEKVGTEEVDHAKTTAEEEEVRTGEEDERKEEAIESLLDSARIEDEESDQGTENQKRQEDPITTRRSGQMMERGSTSSAREQNRRLVPLNRSGAQAVMPCGASLGSGGSLGPYQQERFGLQEPRWLVVDHLYTDGFGLYNPQWRFRTITPLMPNQNIPQHQLMTMELPSEPGPVLVCYNRSFGMLHQNQLVPHEAVLRPHPMMPEYQVPPIPFRTQAPSPFRTQAPMRPLLPQEDFVVYLGEVPVRPMMYYQEQNQIVPNAGIAPARPGYSLRQFEAPMRLPPIAYYTPPPIVNAAPVRPMMYNQQLLPRFNQGQRFRFPTQQHQASHSAVAQWLEQNQQFLYQTQLHSSQSSQGPNADEASSSSGESQG